MKKILVVVDMQKDFVDGALGSTEAQAIVDNVVNKIDKFDGDIIATYDTHPDNYMESQEGKNLPVPHCIKGTDGWMLDTRVQSALDKRGYKAIEKPTFGSTELVEYIKANYNPDEVDIGTVTSCFAPQPSQKVSPGARFLPQLLQKAIIQIPLSKSQCNYSYFSTLKRFLSNYFRLRV